MGQNGGARPGSGRKKGKLSPHKIAENDARKLLTDRVLAKWNPLIDAKLDLALGNYYVEENKDGKKIKVYVKVPNDNAITSLIEQVIGRPKASIEGSISTPDIKDSIESLATSIRGILESNSPNTKEETTN